MRQRINDTNMSYIDGCTIVINICLLVGLELVNGIRYLEPQKNVLCVAIYARATPRHFLMSMTTMGQLRHADYRGVLMLKSLFLSMNKTKDP